MATTAEKVRELRDKTGAGVMDCKEALAQPRGGPRAGGRFPAQEGLAAAVEARPPRGPRRGGRAPTSTPGAKLGVLIEVNCETDFVARTEQFRIWSRAWRCRSRPPTPSGCRGTQVPADGHRARARDLPASRWPTRRSRPRFSRRSSRASSPSSARTRASWTRPTSATRAASCASADLVAQVSAQTGEKIAVRRFRAVPGR